MRINKNTKLQILKEVLKQPSPFGYSDDQRDIMKFLESIWDLRIMPSTDDRFKDAYGDIYQHIINNNDWEYEYLFIDRLNILEDDSIFIKFLNRLIHPETRGDENSVMNYFYLVQPYLKSSELSYNLVKYDSNEIPIYEIGVLKNETNLVGIKENDIPFIVDLHPAGFAEKISSHRRIKKFPYFALAFNPGWNDYQVKSLFYLFYHKNEEEEVSIGEVKIIHSQQIDISEVIGKQFMYLDDSFCSLGQTKDYYKTMREIFGIEFESILWALRDSAFFIENRERFENLPSFKNSLIRENVAERLLREAKFQIYDYDLSNLYSFNYNFKPKFADNSIDVEFNFKDTDYAYDRIYSLIGKNGTGKTQLITSLPIDISRKEEATFIPKPPMFSKVIAVSYSTFDSFEIPNKTASFNYVYCGLKNQDNVRLTEDELLLRFHETRHTINELGRTEQWIRILKNFIDEDSLSLFMKYEKDENTFTPTYTYTFDIDSFNSVQNHLSSGQSIILFIITEIVANIRYDSLILYDEPETHLHPNAISQLINTIYELVHEFKSYCIIATHSPLIIQEVISKNVYVIEREGQFSSIRRIGLESFGENLSKLTEEVFGNREIPKQYQIILKRMVDRGLTYEKIKELLEYDQIPLSVNASIYLKSLLNEKP